MIKLITPFFVLALFSSHAICNDQINIEMPEPHASEYRQLSDRLYEEMVKGNYGYLQIYHPLMSWMLEDKNIEPTEIDRMREELKAEVNDLKQNTEYLDVRFELLCTLQIQDTSFALERWSSTPSSDEEEGKTQEMLYVKYKGYWFVGANTKSINNHYRRITPVNKEEEYTEQELSYMEKIKNSECFNKLNF